METPSLYQAELYLRTVAQDWQAFRFNHGVSARSLRELGSALGDMNAPEFEHHVCDGRNDIALWVDMVICDKRLASKLRLLSTVEATRRMVCRRVDELESCLPRRKSVEEITAGNDLRLANSMRLVKVAAESTGLKAAAAPAKARRAPAARKPSAKRAAAPRAARAAKPPQEEKKSLIDRLFGW